MAASLIIVREDPAGKVRMCRLHGEVVDLDEARLMLAFGHHPLNEFTPTGGEDPVARNELARLSPSPSDRQRVVIGDPQGLAVCEPNDQELRPAPFRARHAGRDQSSIPRGDQVAGDDRFDRAFT